MVVPACENTFEAIEPHSGIYGRRVRVKKCSFSSAPGLPGTCIRRWSLLFSAGPTFQSRSRCRCPTKKKQTGKDSFSPRTTWEQFVLNYQTQSEKFMIGKISITVRLTSCSFWLDSAALLMLNEQQFYLFGQIQISQTGGQLYSDTSPLMVSILWANHIFNICQ